jgi:hypothetical protein
MILEVRTYTMFPNKRSEWLHYYEENGLSIQMRLLGQLVGFFISEIGTLNQVIHMWRYESLADREARRAALARDPEWQTYVANSPPGLLQSQQNQILVPTSFSPMT